MVTMESETDNSIIYNADMFFYATMCHVCKRFGDGVRLRRCSGCRMIAYCGRQHQKRHWTRHRSLCNAIQDVLRDYSMDDVGSLAAEECDDMKMNFMLLVSIKLGRRLEPYETEMFQFPRECGVCHERNGQLEDCRCCASVSFCKNHRDSVTGIRQHKDTCVPLELCLRSNLFFISEESEGPPDLHYLRHISEADRFCDMKDFINIYGNTSTDSKMRDVLAASHSQYLTRPLTLFYAMQILDYVPKRSDLVIHIIAASYIEENTMFSWEALLHLTGDATTLVIIMIGPELKCKSNRSDFLRVCDSCTLREKKVSLEFYDVLYEDYVSCPLFVKPDLVVGFNAGIHEQGLTSAAETWAPSVRMLAQQNCPFITTCYTQHELVEEVDRIDTILDRKVNYLYSGKNPFASLRPLRIPGPEQVFYQNQYLLICRSLGS